MTDRYDPSTPAFAVYGHRGSPLRAPENSLASFDAALASGADGFETDLRRLDDGSDVLFHDDRVADSFVEKYSYDDLASLIPSIARGSDLARYAGNCRMILEVKRAGWEHQLLSIVSRWKPIVVSSFDHRLVAEVARRAPAVPVGAVVAGRLVGAASYLRSIGATWFFPERRLVDRDLVDELRSASICVVPWTVNRPEEWEMLRAIGCDGVITDFPAEAVRWRSALSA